MRTRQVVYYLADALRRCDQLSFVDLCEFTGHGSCTSDKGDYDSISTERDRHVRGLSGAQQQRAMDSFRVSYDGLCAGDGGAKQHRAMRAFRVTAKDVLRSWWLKRVVDLTTL